MGPSMKPKVKLNTACNIMFSICFSCSEGYNFNLYKKHLDQVINSQGREQMHSLLEKCTQSLRLLSYRHFMIFLREVVTLKYICCLVRSSSFKFFGKIIIFDCVRSKKSYTNVTLELVLDKCILLTTTLLLKGCFLL